MICISASAAPSGLKGRHPMIPGATSSPSHRADRSLLSALGVCLLVACGTPGGKAVTNDAGLGLPDAGSASDAGPGDGGSNPGDGGIDRTPIIRTITPPHAPAAGGTVVVVLGKWFVNGFS